VIGVILMVAITVILAAVIGAFVLEIGDQQETAPNTSFDSSEKILYMRGGNSVDRVNTTMVSLSHAGGDVIETSSVSLSVDGDSGSWTIDVPEDSPDIRGTVRVPAKPQPDLTQTLGTNEPVEISSGEQLSVVAYGTTPLDEYVEAGQDYKFAMFLTRQGGGSNDFGFFTEPVPRLFLDDVDSAPKMPNPQLQNNARDDETLFILDSGQSVRLVWEAESGGKTQTLFKYEVQTGSPDF
jgi:FlaG/FlaF family flagellin (archaellin)